MNVITQIQLVLLIYQSCLGILTTDRVSGTYIFREPETHTYNSITLYNDNTFYFSSERSLAFAYSVGKWRATDSSQIELVSYSPFFKNLDYELLRHMPQAFLPDSVFFFEILSKEVNCDECVMFCESDTLQIFPGSNRFPVGLDKTKKYRINCCGFTGKEIALNQIYVGSKIQLIIPDNRGSFLNFDKEKLTIENQVLIFRGNKFRLQP